MEHNPEAASSTYEAKEEAKEARGTEKARALPNLPRLPGLPRLSKRWMAAAALPIVLLLVVARQGRMRPRPLPGLGGTAVSIAYAPNGDLVCGSANGMVQKWMPEIGKWRSFSPNLRGQFSSQFSSQIGTSRLRFSPDGKVLYAGGGLSPFPQESATMAWDAGSRRFLCQLNSVEGRAFDISADGRTAAFGEANGYGVAVYREASSGSLAAPTKESKATGRKWLRPSRVLGSTMASDASLSPDGKYLAVLEVDGSVRVFDVVSGALIQQPRDFPDVGMSVSDCALAWSPDGRWLALCASPASASSKGSLVLWDAQTHQVKQSVLPLVHRESFLAPPVSSSASLLGHTLAFSPDSSRLAIGGPDVRLFSVPGLTQERVLDGAGGVAFSPDGRTLATGSATTPAVLEWNL